MDVTSINWWAIGVSVAAGYVVGGLWYSPALFIRPWARMSGVDGAKFSAGMPKALVMDGISFVIMALALDQVLRAWGATTLAEGVSVTFLVWLGFIATSLLHSVTYEHRPLPFYAINAGYRLVSIAIMGVILTWEK